MCAWIWNWSPGSFAECVVGAEKVARVKVGERWAELDRAELQGQGEAVKRARQARRTERWRKTWPWLVFFGLAAGLMILAAVLGF